VKNKDQKHTAQSRNEPKKGERKAKESQDPERKRKEKGRVMRGVFCVACIRFLITTVFHVTGKKKEKEQEKEKEKKEKREWEKEQKQDFRKRRGGGKRDSFPPISFPVFCCECSFVFSPHPVSVSVSFFSGFCLFCPGKFKKLNRQAYDYSQGHSGT